MTQTRSFLQEEFGGIRSDLDNALRKLAEGASEEIIKSLENVISRFNENLTAQFGENFKKLNEACFQLVQWQQEFKTTVEKSSASIQLSSQAMQSTNQHFENLHEKMAEFDSVLAQMKSAILSMTQSSQVILEALSVQDGLVETFKNKLQETSLKAKELTEQIERGHLKWLDENENRERRLDDSFKRTEERNRELDTHQRNLFNENIKMNETVIQNNRKAIEDLRSASVEYENRLNKSLKSLEDTLISLTNDFGSTYKTLMETTKGLIGNP
jgi:methyl-accepting chemotaxis protein